MSACTSRIGIWAAMLSVLSAAWFSIVALAANFTYLGALWIVTFPALSLALAGVFRRRSQLV